TVAKASLSATADDKVKNYGETNPTFTVSYSGFVGTDNETDLDTPPTASSVATASSNAGDYSIGVEGGTDNNYTFSYNAGTLIVNKATLSAVADDKVKNYGETNPTFTVAYSGFVGTDNESDLDTPPTAHC
ncbi:MBG domain-containing protein, partial [Labilibaculum euxinus]|uniref:MBG domain-containing protein n=1 Tax=Labilibaculum euxinus TaxID=2686357 RepID=UPI00278E1189